MATHKFLRLPAVESATGYRRSTIYRLIQQGKFPRPISLGSRASAWIEYEINEWCESRIRESRERGAS
jgi:prophage regulatory protein